MAQQHSAVIGVIGGTGVYRVDDLLDTVELDLTTPFGKPSSKIVIGSLGTIRLAFISRHGTDHHLLPTEIPFRANVYAFKMLGVKYVLSFTACGSLKEEIRPLDVVLIDQFIDLTKFRTSTFFGDGIVAHVAMADPICPALSGLVKQAIEEVKTKESKLHLGGTYVCIEGASFSTKAESNVYRSWGAAVIGMTGMPEAKLAREAEISYCSVSMVTDYDCWHPDHDNVTVELVMNNLKKNGDLAHRVVKQVASLLNPNSLPVSPAHSALKYAILTHKEHIGPALREKLAPLIGKYL